MVRCCVPSCVVDSFSYDASITFHDFPSNPDMAAKWIHQINAAVTTEGKPMWFPRGKPKICSKHFLHTDFKVDSDSLRPHSIPTVFGYKYIGFNQTIDQTDRTDNYKNKSPLIVKVNKPADCELVISDVYSQNENVPSKSDSSIRSYSKTVPCMQPHPKIISSLSHCSNIGKNLKSTNLGLSAKLNMSLHKLKVKGCLGSKARIVTKPTNLENTIVEDTVVASSDSSQVNSTSSSTLNGDTLPNNTTPNTFINRQPYKYQKRPKANTTINFNKKKKSTVKESNQELIEIGPNTFLKINPKVVKINKKQTPSGNTVLQFIMDQKLAKNQSAEFLPKLVHLSPGKEPVEKTVESGSSINTVSKETKKVKDGDKLQRIISDLINPVEVENTALDDCMVMHDDNAKARDNVIQDISNESNVSTSFQTKSNDETTSKFINKPPVLFSTSIPLRNYRMDKSKLVADLRKKTTQIQILKDKIENLTKQVEELEDRCIVQERQLSYSFIKRLRTIKKNSTKGDACATYILEQIRIYSGIGNKMKWSNSTLAQCAIWCKKAPYAYEYFKKADFIKLPCLATVKRFIKKNPDLVLQRKSKQPFKGQDESSSSSDFDFDETDSEKEGEVEKQQDKNSEEAVACETILSESNNTQNETNPETVAVEGTSVEIQELVLPSGEVVQCYSQNITNGIDGDNQYYIIPNVEGENSSGEQRFNVVQATDETLPAILKNLESSNLQHEQQLIFITNSSEQMECTETEVTTA